MARRPDVPCAQCGRLLWGGTTSLPGGQRVCRPCRKIYGGPTRAGRPRKSHWTRKPCGHCGEVFVVTKNRAVYCSRICANRGAGHARSLHPESSKTLHAHRRSAAPGLSYTARKALLRKWQRRQRACSYCSDLATTMDHVIPLIRGGSNYEGNLAPACRRCNSGKNQWLLTEWRTGRRCTPTAYVLPSPLNLRQRKPRPAKVVPGAN